MVEKRRGKRHRAVLTPGEHDIIRLKTFLDVV